MDVKLSRAPSPLNLSSDPPVSGERRLPLLPPTPSSWRAAGAAWLGQADGFFRRGGLPDAAFAVAITLAIVVEGGSLGQLAVRSIGQ